MAGAALAALAIVLATPAAAQDRDAGAYVGSYEVVVGAGKSQVLQLPEAYANVMVADPKIADVLPLTTHSVYIVGKSLGATAITIYGPGHHLITAVNVVVSADIESLKTRLHELLPEEKDVSIRPANDSIVVAGTVSSPEALHQVVTLAETYDPGKVVNMLTVEGSQQIMLSVRFVEMERKTARQLGVNISTDVSNPLSPNGKPQFAFNTSDTLVNQFGSTVGQIAANYRFGPNSDITVVLDALEDEGLVKTLAEPNLTTMSGESASFLAGGEFPVPIAETAGVANGPPTITVEFKQFGIALAFTPTLLQDGLMNLVVNPEVSAIDPTVAVTTNGLQVPGLKVRRAHATIELRDGESFTIAGLLSDNYQNNINQLPWAGQIPVLGALFRSTAYQRDQTELVIVVTPHLVTPRRGPVATPGDHFVPPSDFEIFLLGQQVGEAENVRPEDRVLLESDPTKGGVDGPHGHVLY